jgi:putative Holliday junction resolvase
VRTGVAVSDSEGLIARPLEVVPTTGLTDSLRRLISEEGVSEVVVGVPKTMGGEVGFQARRVLDTLGALREQFPGVRFVEWDERLTTHMALTGARAGGRRTGRRKRGTRHVDHLAAAQMLHEYLATRETL